MDNDVRPWLDALDGSHRALASLVESLDGDALRKGSYCDQWSVAAVLSHLGSGAEIFHMALDAVVAGEAPPDRTAFPPIWDRWNAMTPEEQATGFVVSDARLVSSLQTAAAHLADAEITMFGRMTVNGVGFVGMRLNEHALHRWDVAVTFDPAATVRSDAVALLVDRLPMAGFAGHAEGAGAARPFAATIATTEPDRAFTVEVGDDVQLAPATGHGGSPGLHLPAEAALRLVFGRFDDQHGPTIADDELPTLDRLRSVFTGF